MRSHNDENDERELVRQVEGDVIGEVASESNYAWGLLEATRLQCQAGARVHDGLECVSCPRFINFVPSRDRKSVTIRCQWSADDSIGEVMKLAAAAVSVAPQTPLPMADSMAREQGIRHMLVFEEADLVGVVCRCRLVPPVLEGETVADRMSTDFVSLQPWSTIAEATELMATAGAGCVPVVCEGHVHGIITRADLLAVGVQLSRFGIEPCNRCGGDHADKPHPQLENLVFCLDCLDRVLATTDYAEVPSTPVTEL